MDTYIVDTSPFVGLAKVGLLSILTVGGPGSRCAR